MNKKQGQLQTEIRSIRYTSYYLNNDKLAIIKNIDNNVKNLKANISKFIHSKIFDLDSKNFQANYKNFKIESLSAWETQSVFQDIMVLYTEIYKKYKQNLTLSIQDSINISYFKKNTKDKNKGDVKTYNVNLKKCNLGNFIKYLVFIDISNIDDIINEDHKLHSVYSHYKNKSWWNRIITFVETLKHNILAKLPVIEFTTGTYRKSPSENGLTKSSYIFTDETNALYKTWFRYKIPGKNKFVDIPLQTNDKYHNKKLRNSEVYIKVHKNKVDVIATYNADSLVFKDDCNVIGMDLNVKHNFASFSNNLVVDYDRQYITKFVKALKKLDKIGSKNLSPLDKCRLNNLVKVNEWYFKKLISEILDELESNNVSDIIMEDLQLFNKTFIKSDEFDIKYSRLVRLLRLSNIKTWMNSQAEKRGIRVHITPAHYSSQQCPKCGSIDRDNRKTQELFQCIQCDHKDNADINSSQNLKIRYTSDVLKYKLHEIDAYKRLRPIKFLKKEIIRKVLVDSYN